MKCFGRAGSARELGAFENGYAERFSLGLEAQEVPRKVDHLVREFERQGAIVQNRRTAGAREDVIF